MNQVDKINQLISEFNSLVDRRNKAEKWFDETTTTEADREKWTPVILKLNADIEIKQKELESTGFIVKEEFIWYGIY